MKLIIVRRSADFMVSLGKNPRIWECGATIAEALGKWVLTHGEDNDIEIVLPPAPKWDLYAGIETHYTGNAVDIPSR